MGSVIAVQGLAMQLVVRWWEKSYFV